MINPKGLVRKVWQGLPRETRKAETGKWVMGRGVVWLRRPEMWCPECQISWVNGWTWLINERKGRVLAVWREDGTKLPLGYVHPHVMFDGSICVGEDGASVIEAITSGFNIHSCFCTGEFHAQMAALGHKDCEQEYESEEIEDHEGESYCDYCECWYDEDRVAWYEQAEEYLCSDCYEDLTRSCDNCRDGVFATSRL